MRVGDLVFTNLFGEKNVSGILVEVRKLPNDALEFYTCKVLLSVGKMKVFPSSQLLTVDEVEEYGIEF